MRKLVLAAVIFIAFSYARSVQACENCAYDYLWPWLDECANCVESNCGYVLCHLQQEGNDDICVLQGNGCNDYGEGNRCPQNVSSLETKWHLAAVRVSTPRVQRSTRIPASRGTKG